MNLIQKTATAFIAGLCLFGAAPALADDDDRYESRGYDDRRYDDRRGGYGRPDRCDLDHDHRSHSPYYYSHFPHDRYFRADPYGRGVTLSIELGGGSWYDRYGRGYGGGYGGGYDPYGGGRGYGDRRVVDRDVIRLRRWRADVIIVEEEHYSRRGRYGVCTISTRGPDAHYVPRQVLRDIAYDNCRRGYEIRFYA